VEIKSLAPHAIDARFPSDRVGCEKGHVEAARLLLDNGAEVDRARENGCTPLWIACANGHASLAQSLWERGAKIHRASKDGATPIFAACQKGHVDAVRLLLDNGAEIDQADRWGTTPLDAAKKYRHDAVVALLEEHLDLKFPLHAAARTGDVEAMTPLLDGGAEVDAKKDGATPLFVACEGGHVDAARLLLERGAVVDSSALCEGDTVEAKYRGRGYYPGKISRDCGEGKYDIAYDKGWRESGVEARLIRKLPLSPLAIAEEKGHAAVVALLEERQK